jgi:hypothetical protein
MIIPVGILAVLALGLLVLLAPRTPSVPHPWGSIQLIKLSTSGTKKQATFTFTSYFGWAVLIETATETKTNGGWPDRWREPNYTAILAPVPTGGSSTFTVDVPDSTEPWRVLVKSTKQDITAADRRRQRMRSWFMRNGIDIVADRISAEATAHYLTLGQEMTQ